MLKYLTILLDDAAVSFCHYKVSKCPNVISEEVLRKGITFAMKENLSTQFVFPNHELPEYVYDIIATIEHTKIGKEDVTVYNEWPHRFNEYENCVIRITLKDLLSTELPSVLPMRMNIMLMDIESCTEKDFVLYKSWLEKNAEILKGKNCQINILTDRTSLSEMNNCNAGYESITLAPDGKFYVCPGFYQDDMGDVGNLNDGLLIRNQHLYELRYAPICRTCDAYHCKRCIWLNKKTTLEVNTPSKEQCVISHLERNASRILTPDRITEINYLDPFENLIK